MVQIKMSTRSVLAALMLLCGLASSAGVTFKFSAGTIDAGAVSYTHLTLPTVLRV